MPTQLEIDQNLELNEVYTSLTSEEAKTKILTDRLARTQQVVDILRDYIETNDPTLFKQLFGAPATRRGP